MLQLGNFLEQKKKGSGNFGSIRKKKKNQQILSNLKSKQCPAFSVKAKINRVCRNMGMGGYSRQDVESFSLYPIITLSGGKHHFSGSDRAVFRRRLLH